MPDSPVDHETALAVRLRQGVDALNSNQPDRAIEPLRDVCNDPILREAPNMADVRARALSLFAQALHQTEQWAEARHIIDSALLLTRRLGEPDGLAEVEALRADILTASGGSTSHAAGLRPPPTGIDAMLAQANAHLDANATQRAIETAQAALTAAEAENDVRGGVLSRLTLARAEPVAAPKWVKEALRLADEASDFTLVGIIARTAELHGIPLPTEPAPPASGNP